MLEHVVRVGHHLLQIPGAARHRVVEHQEVDARPGIRGREPADHHAQVIHRPREPAPQAQLQGRDERADARIGLHAAGGGDEHPHRLGLELAIEIEAVHDRRARRRRRRFVRAGSRRRRLRRPRNGGTARSPCAARRGPRRPSASPDRPCARSSSPETSRRARTRSRRAAPNRPSRRRATRTRGRNRPPTDGCRTGARGRRARP